MKVFLLCLLFVGANAGFLDSLQLGQIKEKLATKVSSILSPLLREEWGTILGLVVVEVTEYAVKSYLGKREIPHKVTIKEVLANGAEALKQLFENYATELQHYSEQIASRDYLKGDVPQFFTDMTHSKLIHDEKFDNIVSSVKRILNCDKRKAADNIIISRACEQFSEAANMLQEEFSNVHDQLVGGSNSILGAVHDHLSLLNDTLAD